LVYFVLLIESKTGPTYEPSYNLQLDNKQVTWPQW